MDNLPGWLVKVQSVWLAAGVFLATVAAQGSIPIPEFLLGLVTEEVFDSFLSAFGAVTAFVQLVRSQFMPKEGEVQVLAANAKRKYMLNPFKLRI